MTNTAAIPITAAEPFIKFILEAKAEYASLIALPTTGMRPLTIKRIPREAALSAAEDKMLLRDRNPVKNAAALPRTKFAHFPAAERKRLQFTCPFIEKAMERHSITPVNGTTSFAVSSETPSAKSSVNEL